MAATTLTEVLAANAAVRGDAVAVVQAAPNAATQPALFTLTYDALYETVRAAAADLVSHGVCPGDRVSLVLPNSVDFIVGFLACTVARAIAAPLNPDAAYAELANYIADAGAKAVLVSGDSSAAARDAAYNARLVLLEIRVAQPLAGGGVIQRVGTLGAIRRSDVHGPACPTDLALFLHTSGTTGKPKGVPITHANLLASMYNIARAYALTPADRTLLVMPLFHVHGLVGALLATLAAGASAVVQWPKFSARSFWPLCTAHQCTWYTAVPTMHQILLKHAAADFVPQPQLRFIRSCSSALPAPVLAEVEARFGAPVLEAYAMSEAAHQMTTNPLPPAPHKPASVGRPVGLQLAILQHGTVRSVGGGLEGDRAAHGTPGEVVVRGRNVFAGYWHNPDANATAFVTLPETGAGVGPAGAGHPAHPPFAPGVPLPAPGTPWMRTGDEGYLDQDGYVFLTGRIKELIKRGGESISPPEIDAVLLAHPAVAEAVTFGVDDAHYGQVVHAAIVLKDDAAAAGARAPTEADILAFVRQRLAPAKVPVQLYMVRDLPRTATGKLQRKAVGEHFAKRPAPKL